MKKYFYPILNYIVLLSSTLILGIMQGGWFNREKILNRDDVEIYSIPSWKYHVYYIVLCTLFIINVYLVFCLLPKRVTIASKIHAFILLALTILLFLLLALTV